MHYLVVILPLWLLYLLLTGNGEVSNLIVGLVLAVGAAALLRPLPRPIIWRRVPGALLAAVQYVGVLLWDLARSGIQVTRIVLSPKLSIEPGVVAIPSGCASELATALSAHAITVTPGEMVVEIDADGVMYTHCLRVDAAAEYVARAQTMRRDLLQRIFV
ncbi:MAG: Na+/H+ antiporter subunit E [Anaerolineales bacterium]|nr:Na+/H+ antiporter subunit E [Anaerolineales bacterium]MCA9975789.1 Na+/H+ antiporter subunit E [Anaerolineales bacterium]MCB8966581.1 Na+/H+ antiporter subunit E [Ardenticatenaceae bacterium]